MMRQTAQKPWISMAAFKPPVPAARQPLERDDFQTAFESLVNRHWAPLCRTLFHLLGDWDEAEDLALEAFLQLYRHPPAEAHNLIGWLYRVATNMGFNALRAQKRRHFYETQAGQEDFENNTPVDPAHEMERKVEQENVRAALQALKPRSAALLLLRNTGLSYAEIAAALQIAPGSVGTLLARAEKEFEQAYRSQ